LSCHLYIERYNGFRKAIDQNGIPLIRDNIFFHELTPVNARKTMRRLFSKKPYPDGIIAANDVTALEALSFAKEIGIQVPGELKIVGYSNDPRSSIVSPSITTIEQFPAQIGKAITEEALRILKNGIGEIAMDTAPVITPVQLIRRMST
jgi:LacI family transcriptional regulator